jgi:mono/diheme cytochrome c family protein
MLRALDRVLTALAAAAAVLLVVLLATGPSLIGAKAEGGAAPNDYPGSGPAAADGRALFTDNCGSCHTLAAAGTSGSVGPNLDEAAPSAERVSAIVTAGSGVMPSFSGTLSEAEIAAVAEFVAGG